MTYKNKKRYYKSKTYKNKRKSQLKKRNSHRGGSIQTIPNKGSQVVSEHNSHNKDNQKTIMDEIQYEEEKVKKGLATFPTGDAKYFKIIDLKNENYRTKFSNISVSLGYASLRGKAFEKMKKSIPDPDNYYFKVGNLPNDLKNSNVFVSAKHVIINPKDVPKLFDYLKDHKGYYLVVAHIEESNGKKFMYRLPHRGFISCDKKSIILMTTGGETMTYNISDNPRYRFIGLKKDDSHGEMYTMVNSLNEVSNIPEAFKKLLEGFRKQLPPSPIGEVPKSDVKSIVKYHFEKSLKDGTTPREKEILENLSALVHLKQCPPSKEKAHKALLPNK